MNRLKIQKKYAGMAPFLFIAPAVILMGVFIVYPLISSLNISTISKSVIGPGDFIGFKNYVELFRDPTFWNSVLLQFIWALMSLVILATTGLILALIVEYFIPIKRFVPAVRTIFFMPMMMSMVVIGLLWSLVFNPLIGVLNEVLHALNLLGPAQVLDLLGESKTALYAVFLPTIWQWTGFGMVVFSAAMQGIPQRLLEASIVDGCSRFMQIRHVIMPLLAPTFALQCTINLIGGLKCFDIIYVMTNGGPGTSTLVSSIYIFRQAFILNNHGYAAAISTIMFILTALFGILVFQYTNRLQNYI